MRDGEIHVWLANTAVAPEALADRWALLAADERVRADRFRLPVHRVRFIAARAFLRGLLSRYTGVPAAALRFATGPHGKPALTDAPAIAFNLSHSHDAAVCAIAARPVGVDVERLRAMPAALAIAERYFSVPEREALARVPAEGRDAAFFTCWTRKEAFIKGIGRGLGFPLRDFSVSIARGGPIALSGVSTEGWTLHDVEAEEGYLAAVAIEAPAADVIRRLWPA